MKSSEVGYTLEDKPKRRGSARRPSRLPIGQRALIDSKECGDYLGMGWQKARRISDEIGATRRIGGRILIDRRMIDKWIENLGQSAEG